MANKHTITVRDKWFLDKHMKDPVTHEPFKVGDTIIICASCKTAHDISTWGLNPSKCCSTCESNNQLRYNSFSPAIFQPKRTYSSRFSIVDEKLPFMQRLKLFNGYPIANIVTVLLPILVVALLAYSVHNQAVFNMADQLSVEQEKFENLGETSLNKLTLVINKPKSLDIDFGNMNIKLETVASSFDNVKPKYTQTMIGDKLMGSFTTADTTFEHAREKLSQFFSAVFEFVSSTFGG